MVYGLWFLVFGLWFIVYGLWFMVYGLGLWLGLWFMVNTQVQGVWLRVNTEAGQADKAARREIHEASLSKKRGLFARVLYYTTK